jgi:hypothetical protein
LATTVMVVLSEHLEPARHGLGGHEDGAGQGQREDNQVDRRLDGFSIADSETEVRHQPREREAEREGDADGGEHAADASPGPDPRSPAHGEEILIRCDSAGASHAFLRHIRDLREQGVRAFFSVGVPITEPVRAAIVACLDWMAAIDADRDLRDGAQIAELSHLVDLSAYPRARG